MPNNNLELFSKGVYNLADNEIIPADAASDSLNWLTQNGRIVLSYGSQLVGAGGAVGNITGEIFGYKNDGTKIHWRKALTKIQYTTDEITWHDTVTSLTSTADYSFTNYSSLAGTFTFAIGADGIYKMHNANPGSYCAMYDSTKNFKGLAFIDKGRMILWNRSDALGTDKTGLYGSRIDRQNSAVYTAVSGEATTTLTGTLGFKSGHATRNCFAVTITLSGSGEVFTDNGRGVLTGTLGGTGTINYITGDYTLSNAGTGTANYQWEDSNALGVTDFTKSSTRLAGEGFQFPQDEGGDAILNVLIGIDGTYFSMKSQSAYQLILSDDDLTASNLVYRKDIGIPSYRGGVSTNKGIVFLNNANPAKPELTILQRNPLGDNIEPVILCPQFKFANYLYDDCLVETYDRYVIIACKTLTATQNDTLLLADLATGTIDITGYSARTSVKNAGQLYIGSPISASVYNIFSGFDDNGTTIQNFWTGKGELFKTERLKKYRKIKLKGRISAGQSYEVYVNYDDAGPQLVGTILGSGSYVDYTSPQSIGSNMIGEAQIGGDTITDIYPYYTELKIKTPKFRKRIITFVAKGYGYLDIESITDWDLLLFEERLPARYRVKQYQSLDGTQSDLTNPQF